MNLGHLYLPALHDSSGRPEAGGPQALRASSVPPCLRVEFVSVFSIPSVGLSHAKRARERSCALRASSSRLRGGALVLSDSSNRCAAAVTSSTASLNAGSFARDGRVVPLSLRTN